MKSIYTSILIALGMFGVFLLGVFYLQKLFLNKVFATIDDSRRVVKSHDFSQADRD